MEHHRSGRLAEADRIYRQVLVANPNHPDALHLLGLIHAQRGQPQLAAELISRAIKARPNVAQFHCRLAEVLRALRRYDEALASFRRAIELGDNDPTIHNSFGAALADARQFDLAMAEFRRAADLQPDNADAHSNLGATLVATGRLDEAVAELQIALKLNPRMRGAHNNLGNALYNQGKIAEAIAEFEIVASFNPNDSKIHANLALAYLLLGDFPRGWKEHEWRLKVPEIVGTRQFMQPRWDGSDLAGKTVLLHPEQGFGDMIQFARFIPQVASRGGRIILETPAELFRLFKNFPGVSEVVQRDQPLPKFDMHCPIVSLGYVFNVNAETIPAQIPYLKPDSELVQKWKQRFDPADKRLRVGLTWAGRPQHTNERNRSMKLAQFAPLAPLDSITLYSLQKGDASAQTAQPPSGLRLNDWTADLTDFADTAALIENLDLVLTVDTAVAHLAGAMGKRVWLLLPWIPDWRWMLHRTDSPWYPNLRIFRQQKIGDWAEVLQQVAHSLQNEPR